MKKLNLRTILLVTFCLLSINAFGHGYSGDVVVNGHPVDYKRISEKDFKLCGHLPPGNYIINVDTGAWAYAEERRTRGYMSDRCVTLYTTNYRRDHRQISHDHFYHYHDGRHHHNYHSRHVH